MVQAPIDSIARVEMTDNRSELFFEFCKNFSIDDEGSQHRLITPPSKHAKTSQSSHFFLYLYTIFSTLKSNPAYPLSLISYKKIYSS